MIDEKQQVPQDQQKQFIEESCQTGKSFEEVLPYLLSGESDELASEVTDKL